jgi:hypothetical protein
MKNDLVTTLVTTAFAGAFLLTPGTSLANTATAPAAPSVAPAVLTDLSIQEASQKAGVDIKLPARIPEGSFLGNISYVQSTGKVILSYVGTQNKPFYLEIRKGSLQEESSLLQHKVEIQLSREKALAGTKQAFGDMNVLVWEEEPGIVYQLVSGAPLEELMTIADSIGKDSTPASSSIIQLQTISNLTAEEAAKKVGFPVKLPTFLPKGMKLAIAYEKGMSADDQSITIYSSIASKEIPFLSIIVRKGDLRKEAMEFAQRPSSLVETKLGNRPAYIAKIPGSSFHDPNLTERNGLTFEVGSGIIYTITSDLPIDEIKKVAESIK